MACVTLNAMTRETRPTYFWSEVQSLQNLPGAAQDVLTKGQCVHRESQLTLRISRMDQLRTYECALRGDIDTSANLKAYFCHFSLSCFLFAARSAFPTGYVLSCGASQVWFLSLSKPRRPPQQEGNAQHGALSLLLEVLSAVFPCKV